MIYFTVDGQLNQMKMGWRRFNNLYDILFFEYQNTNIISKLMEEFSYQAFSDEKEAFT